MTGRPRHGDRLRFARGHRPRTSTLVLIGLFVGVLALYFLVRPLPAPAANMRQVTQTPSHQPYVPKTYSPSPTRSPSHSPSPSPHRTATPTLTPTPTTSASSGQPSATPSVTSPGSASPALLPGGSPTAIP
jgi:hypothetical protein